MVNEKPYDKYKNTIFVFFVKLRSLKYVFGYVLKLYFT